MSDTTYSRLAAAALALCAVSGVARAAEPAIAATGAHVLVSKSDGTVSGWGSDFLGKLGTGRAIVRHSPGQVAGLPSITQLAAYTYGFHIVARDANGRVWTWGQNDFGQLGPRVQRNASLAGRVQGLANVIQVAATAQASIALKSDGTVWAWGYGSWGSTLAQPTPVAGLTGIVQIAAGSHHYFARRNDGTVWAVGWNSQNQLGVGMPSPIWTQFGTPTQVPLPAGVVEVAATILGGAARTGDGKVWSWGSSEWQAMGDATPREVTGFPAAPVRLVGETMMYHAVLPNGTLWRWGHASAPVQAAGFAAVRSVGGEVEVDDSGDYVVVDDAGVMRVRSGNAYGQRGLGAIGETDHTLVTQVPSPTNFVSVRWMNHCVLGVGADGKVWAWGADASGSLGDGTLQTSAAPRAVAGLAAIKQVAAGRDWSAALDDSGNVWFWGENPGSISGDGMFSPRSTPIQVPIANVQAIAAGWSHLLHLKVDGSVWITGFLRGVGYSTPTQVTGLPSIKAIAAGHESAFAVALDGQLYAWGANDRGELGTGDGLPRAAPTAVAVPLGVVRIATEFKQVLAVNGIGDVYGWGDIDTRNTLGAPSNPADIATSPQKVAGISGAVDVAVGQFHFLARLASGTVLSWGPAWQTEPLGRDAGAATPPHVPSPVLELDGVIAIAAANHASYAIRSDGTVWGWGLNWASGAGPSVGDGTFARRTRPVVVIRENGAGNLDTNNWFLDAKPGVPKSIPAAKVPRVVSVAQSLSGSTLLNVDGAVAVRLADQPKRLGLFVVGLVPPAFLSQPGAAPGAHAKVAGMKADTLILVNLTPAGWTLAAGQLSAFASGTGNAFLGASGLLTNVDPAAIPGARFCIGYGENATDMISTGTISDFLSLQGASADSLGSRCLVSGVYVDGPPTSALGSAVPVRAVVVGQSPTGTVRFRERLTDISANLSISPVNAAVSSASVLYTPSAAGEYAFGAVYGGDGLNAAVASEVPLRHVVRPVLASSTTRIDASVTSEVGLEVTLVAYVSGNAPAGTVQFRRGGVDQGAPVPVVGDRAAIPVVGLAIGNHSFTAHYSGDAGNQPSVSAAFIHQVLDVATSGVALRSSANPATYGTVVTLTAGVTGTNPTGTVTLREGANVLEAKSLAGGTASFTLPALSAGIHVFAVDYSGDGGNPAATSNAVFQQVTLNLPPQGDVDGDGIPNGVETAEGRNPLAKDNDIFTVARLFAMQQYRDFLGREGDAGGVTHWTNQLSGGAQNRSQMVETFFNSAEFQGTGAPVVRLYFAYFLRIPDYGGLQFWISRFRAGNSLESISNAFAGSPEFANTYGALTNSQFVDRVYRNVLGRAPDSAGLAHWTGQLDAGMTRGQMMIAFSESPEYRALIDSEVYVTMMYVGMLRRAPDPGGFSFWVSYRDQGNSGLALIDGFLASPEYRSRFLP